MIFYSNPARPQAKFTLWLIYMERLATKDRLLKFGIPTDGKCMYCDHLENIDDLFFNCEKSRNVWKSILGWTGYYRNPLSWSTRTWITLETKRKGWRRKLLKLAIAETIYTIWRDMNAKIFQPQSKKIDMVETIRYNVLIRCVLHRDISQVNHNTQCFDIVW